MTVQGYTLNNPFSTDIDEFVEYEDAQEYRIQTIHLLSKDCELIDEDLDSQIYVKECMMEEDKGEYIND